MEPIPILYLKTGHGSEVYPAFPIYIVLGDNPVVSEGSISS